VPQDPQFPLNLGLLPTAPEVEQLIACLRKMAEPDGLWQAVDYPVGRTLFDPGEVSGQLWVLERGLVKLGYLTAGGDDWTKSFIVDRGVFSGSGDLSRQGNNRFGASCLEPSRLIALPLDWLAAGLAADQALQTAFARFGGWLQSRKQQREEALLCQSAEARYRQFLGEQPDLARRLRQADIARYVGITPIALSRIRKRMGLSNRMP
jgi:CRP/FNR family transcriptional regulator, anaerobic regulatory protein